MPEDAKSRATELATTALKLHRDGKVTDAVRTLREAISLSPETPAVLAAFKQLQESKDVQSIISTLCSKLVRDSDIQSGQEALRMIRGGVTISVDVGERIFDTLLLSEKSENEKILELQRQLIQALTRESREFREAWMKRIVVADGLFRSYSKASKVGEEAIDALSVICLDQPIWISQESSKREKCVKELSELLLQDIQSPTLRPKTIRPSIRVLSTETELLSSSIDNDKISNLLNLFATEESKAIRTGGILALVKFLEKMGTEESQKFLTGFFVGKLASNSDTNLITAFSTASTLFPVVPSIATALFLTEGFLSQLLDVLKTRVERIELAALEMFSAACIDKSCREAIAKNCQDYLLSIVKSKKSGRGEAAVILAKIMGDNSSTKEEDSKVTNEDGGIETLTKIFRGLMSDKNKNDSQMQVAVEGLAFSSLTPSVKESLASDKDLLKSLVSMLEKGNPSQTYGILTIFANITTYQKKVSEEQKKMEELRNYANADKKTQSKKADPLEDASKVTIRCKVVLDAGIMPALVKFGKDISPNNMSLICRIINSLSRTTAHRGAIAQQGGVKQLVQFFNLVSPTKEDQRTNVQNDMLENAGHGLARILISVNPSHVFGGSGLPLSSAIPPLINLAQSIQSSTADYRDLLPQFEALLALTNLASTTDSARELIIRLGWQLNEELLLADNEMVQRAAVELICNLMLSPQGVAKFADGSKQAKNRMHIIVALANVDDLATRRAAGGALAMLTEWDAAVKAILDRERGVDTLLKLVSSDNLELVHRGVVSVRNVVIEGGQPGIDKVKEEGGIEVLKSVLQKTKAEDIMIPLAEALKVLL